MIKVEIKMFGAFRKYENNKEITYFESTTPIKVEDLKNILSSKLAVLNKNDSILIHDSALAHATVHNPSIIHKNTMIHESCTLVILPPVCGG